MSTRSMMLRLRSRLKDAAIGSLYLSGILWAIARARLRDRIVVLTYHRVLPVRRQADSFSAPGIVVTPETFDRQMGFLRRFFNPIGIDEFVDALQSGRRMPPWSCLVTFDDGWYDTLDFALPILRRYSIPAVLFVAADYIGSGRCFWQERLSRILFTLRDFPEAQRIVATVGPESGQDSVCLANRDSIRAFVTRLKSSPPGVVASLLEELGKVGTAVSGNGEDRFLDWNEVIELASSGIVEIGSHAMSHRPLAHMPLVDAKRELTQSRDVLGSRLKKAPIALAYPDGDTSPKVSAMARELGFAAAFTTMPGHVSAGADHFMLRRVNIHEGSTRTRSGFLARLLGLT